MGGSTHTHSSFFSASFLLLSVSFHPFLPWPFSPCLPPYRARHATCWLSVSTQKATAATLAYFLFFIYLFIFSLASLFLLHEYSVSVSLRTYLLPQVLIYLPSSLSAVWRRIHELSGKHPLRPAPVLHIRNTLISNPLEVATELGTHFSLVSCGSHLPPQFILLKAAREQNPITFTLSSDYSYNAPFSIAELSSALQSCKNTCEGPDGVHYQMLKHLTPHLYPFYWPFSTVYD